MKINILFCGVFLLSIMGYSQIVVEDSKLLFTYDNAGNQTTRRFCYAADNCDASFQEAEKQLNEEETITSTILDKSIQLYPNPTSGKLVIKWDKGFNNQIHTIDFVDITSRIYKINFKPGDSQTSIDLSEWPIGLYFVRLHVEDGHIINKKVIKN